MKKEKVLVTDAEALTIRPTPNTRRIATSDEVARLLATRAALLDELESAARQLSEAEQNDAAREAYAFVAQVRG